MATARKKKPAPIPEPTSVTEQDVVAVLVEVAFTLEGQPTGIVARMQTVMPRPSANQDAWRFQVGLDARQTIQALEPCLGPLSVTSKIVTPGSPGFMLPGRQ